MTTTTPARRLLDDVDVPTTSVCASASAPATANAAAAAAAANHHIAHGMFWLYTTCVLCQNRARARVRNGVHVCTRRVYTIMHTHTNFNSGAGRNATTRSVGIYLCSCCAVYLNICICAYIYILNARVRHPRACRCVQLKSTPRGFCAFVLHRSVHLYMYTKVRKRSGAHVKCASTIDVYKQH